jgi:hypothetical protein
MTRPAAFGLVLGRGPVRLDTGIDNQLPPGGWTAEVWAITPD